MFRFFKKKIKIICSADLHGNIIQYKKLFKYAIKEKVDAIIIAGDITPKRGERTPLRQANFLKNELIPEIKKFKKNSGAELFLMFGNDDFKANEYILKKYDEQLWKYINETTKKFKEYFIFGYTYVPLTPYIYKDWEKIDTEKIHEITYRAPFTNKGFKSTKTKLTSFEINLENRSDNIEKDIIRGTSNLNSKKLILVTHAPPYETKLDLNNEKKHVGSLGVKNAIKTIMPLLSVHGHIHETVNISGSYKDKIGKTKCITPGNFFTEKKLTIIELTLPSLKTQRKTI